MFCFEFSLLLELRLVQCCVCQQHPLSKFPNTVSPLWSLMLWPFLALHLLTPRGRQKQAGFPCTLRSRLVLKSHKQRSFIYLSLWHGLSTAPCTVVTQCLYEITTSPSHVVGGEKLRAAWTYLRGSKLKKLSSWRTCGSQAALRSMTRATQRRKQQEPPSLTFLPPRYPSWSSDSEQYSWHSTVRIILVIPILILCCWEARAQLAQRFFSQHCRPASNSDL